MRQLSIAGHQQLSKAPLMSTLTTRQYSFCLNASLMIDDSATSASSAPLSGRKAYWLSVIHYLVSAYHVRRLDTSFSRHLPSKSKRLIGRLALCVSSG
ncbi:unnamed protein product [Sphagnum jensenii]|uniref:Uncharacterized protein n=1 Tax=Sphagnum jensenii TaxID=128206 RepID=A0ABP0V8N0_9BRYO